jgi:hypothetical protein
VGPLSPGGVVGPARVGAQRRATSGPFSPGTRSTTSRRTGWDGRPAGEGQNRPAETRRVATPGRVAWRHLGAMPPPTHQLRVRARLTAGVSTATFSFEREGVVVGHAVRRIRHDGAVIWYVTDQEAPPFVVEVATAARTRSWLLSRPDGAPFARIAVAAERPLDLEVLEVREHHVRVSDDGTLSADDGTRLGRIDLDAAAAGDPAGTALELPTGGDPTLRAALLTIPLCVVPPAVGPVGVPVGA